MGKPAIEVAEETLQALVDEGWKVGLELAEKGKTPCFGLVYTDDAVCKICESRTECETVYNSREIFDEDAEIKTIQSKLADAGTLWIQ